jgi:hypothetical protein
MPGTCIFSTHVGVFTNMTFGAQLLVKNTNNGENMALDLL